MVKRRNGRGQEYLTNQRPEQKRRKGSKHEKKSHKFSDSDTSMKDISRKNSSSISGSTPGDSVTDF
ncbi:194_t:CDS:2 [Funneliformis geosporum]|uniref:194_t:CDS:1 n=1 Tax=Funneliformis geosporum TaxID=1117311 RepID=A0A9W4SLQ7_9GLOM|nr:194_t:CDS:2 [Funneliformis geosporum]